MEYIWKHIPVYKAVIGRYQAKKHGGSGVWVGLAPVTQCKWSCFSTGSFRLFSGLAHDRHLSKAGVLGDRGYEVRARSSGTPTHTEHLEAGVVRDRCYEGSRNLVCCYSGNYRALGIWSCWRLRSQSRNLFCWYSGTYRPLGCWSREGGGHTLTRLSFAGSQRKCTLTDLRSRSCKEYSSPGASGGELSLVLHGMTRNLIQAVAGSEMTSGVEFGSSLGKVQTNWVEKFPSRLTILFFMFEEKNS